MSISSWKVAQSLLSYSSKNRISACPLDCWNSAISHIFSRCNSRVLTNSVPESWHHFYGFEKTTERELEFDGYESRFVPPLNDIYKELTNLQNTPLWRRVWYKSHLEWNNNIPLLIGDDIEETVTLKDFKYNTSGINNCSIKLYVETERLMSNASGLAVREIRSLVYYNVLDNSTAQKIQSTSSSNRISRQHVPKWIVNFMPTPILLFRYSALTYNSHRIHYDSNYAKVNEGYEDILIHGPLTSCLLIELARRMLPAEIKFKSWSYKALSPLYCNQEVQLMGNIVGETVKLWAKQGDRLGMTGTLLISK